MIRCLVVIAALLVIPSACSAQAAAPKESLRGLKGIYVKVLNIDKEVEELVGCQVWNEG